jgi:hypothetical protein
MTKKRMEKKREKARIAPGPFDSASVYIRSDTVISRRNQNGTVVLMKVDDSSVFFKVSGLSAHIWCELELPKSAAGLVEHLARIYPQKKTQLLKDVPALMREISKKGLIVKSQAKEDSKMLSPLGPPPKKFEFGEIKEFNLEEIESEVLNESIYLEVFAGSDLRLKKNIRPIRGALRKVEALEGITYRWRQRAVPKHVNTTRVQAGLVAQDVARAMPELVRRDETKGILAVEYSKLTSYLVEAVKELSSLVRVQERRIRELEKTKRTA